MELSCTKSSLVHDYYFYDILSFTFSLLNGVIAILIIIKQEETSLPYDLLWSIMEYFFISLDCTNFKTGFWYSCEREIQIKIEYTLFSDIFLLLKQEKYDLKREKTGSNHVHIQNCSCLIRTVFKVVWPDDYKSFFMLNWAEHEISMLDESHLINLLGDLFDV